MTREIKLSREHPKGQFCYWGTPLEKLAFELKVTMIMGDSKMAYDTTRKLYRGFMRINPDFWSE